MVARDGAELQHDSASTQSWMVSGACLDRTNSAIKAQGGPMLNELQALRKLVIANGGSNAERLNELECLQAWARLKGVQNTAWKNELDCLRALVVANGGPNAEHLNEVQCLRKLANLAGCAPVENLLETDLYNVLLNPQQFIFNKQYVSAPSIQSLTNAQKLSLPANTLVGTEVRVTDALQVVSESFNPGFYPPIGTENGKPVYRLFPPVINPDDNTDTNIRFYYNSGEGRWAYWDGQSDALLAAAGNENSPWLASWEVEPPFIVNPVSQKLAAASSARAAYFIVGGGLDGIFTIRGDYEGREYANIIGHQNEADGSAISWNFNGAYNGTNKWVLWDNSGNALVYSSSNLATPDLATNWKNASDDSPASITVTNVTQGELDAGLSLGPGFETPNSSAIAIGSNDGRLSYLAGQFDDTLIWVNEGGLWSQAGDPAGIGNTAFPWQANWAPTTVTRNNVASESNWQVVP